jgi:hypothetical protein
MRSPANYFSTVINNGYKQLKNIFDALGIYETGPPPTASVLKYFLHSRSVFPKNQ